MNYRVNPYTDEGSALDLSRAVKIVRANAAQYGIDENRIAAAGFSYGGIIASLEADIYSGEANASALMADIFMQNVYAGTAAAPTGEQAAPQE